MMMILKRAMDECCIRQKELSRLTGFGKTQVSLSLNSGKLPANAEKFTAGVTALVNANSVLIDWLCINNLSIEQLWQPIAPPCKATDNEIPIIIHGIVGRGLLSESILTVELISIAKAAVHLYRNIVLLVENEQLININCEVKQILKGGTTPC